MRIKKLEIVGFKSFCDRTVISFDHPITGVVGPNGCGKSNIVDAVRWCMGEQSAKHLRGKSMDDIIFAGSDSRGPLGMAEVSMTFENNALGTGDGLVPIEYVSYSEITVTRRLFRDGTSDYLINKVPVRLRDVVDFFLGTGIGTKAYSIIEQGRVGMIVTSKPEDRRMLIEEAAGITKYKAKKKAAEKKMEATRQNLLRVNDILGELDKQLGSLRRQAQKAERYRKYKDEIRDLELWSMSQRWLGAVAESRVITETLAEKSESRQTLQLEIATKDTLVVAERITAADEERRLSQLQHALYELDNRIKLTETNIEFARRDSQGLIQRGQAARGEIEAVLRRDEQLRGEEAALSAELEQVSQGANLDAESLAEREEVHRVLRAELSRSQGLIEEHRRAAGKASNEMARGDGDRKNLERRREELVSRCVRLREERMQCDERAGMLEGDVTALAARVEELRAEIDERKSLKIAEEMRLKASREQQARGEMEIETLRTELHRRKSRLTSLCEIQEKYEGFQRGVRAIMQGEHREGVRGLVADIVQTPAEYEAAVAAVLGERLGSILVESQEAGLDAVGYLKQKAQGRSTFIPMAPAGVHGSSDGLAFAANDCVPAGSRPLLELVGFERDYANVAGYLLGDTILVDDLASALSTFRQDSGANGRARYTYVTRDGDVIDPYGVVTGGSRESGAGVLQQKREIRELEEIITRIEADYEVVLGRHVEVRAEVTALAESIEQRKQELHQGEIDLLGYQKDLTRARDEHNRAKERATHLENEELELGDRQSEAAREADEAEALCAAARERLATAEAELATLGEVARELLFKVDEAQVASTELRVKVAAVGERRHSLTQSLGRMGGELAELETRRAKLEQQIVAEDERAQELIKQAEEAEATLGEMVTDSAHRSKHLSDDRQVYEAKLLEIQEQEAVLRGQRSAETALADEIRELERRWQSVDNTRARLEETADEKYRLHVGNGGLSGAAFDYHLRALFGGADEARLRELKDLIDRMGEVNLSAIAEHDELAKRFEFLSTQKADLEDALDRLEKAIAKINRASKKRFEETFHAVNAKFQEVFPRLFRGGQARLELVPIVGRGEAAAGLDDVLEAGLEIFAQPPGKKQQSVELMSGGEKALTAVALIFSIFLIKPSPFCLLDEVDAPLDDANVIRYNEMIREMTDRSQFIVISHKKSTMTIADQLYGVTMEEPGISKIVGVNLRAIEKKAEAA